MTTADANTEKRMETIQKLLNKAERAGSEEEAQAFASKAEELMTKWMIDDAMLRASGKLEQEKIEKRTFPWKTSYFTSDTILLDGIARAHNCKILIGYSKKYFVIIGFTSDVDNVQNLFVSMQLQAARFAQRAFKTYTEETVYANDVMKPMDKYVWRRSFRDGFGNRIGERLQEQMRRTVADEAKTRGSGMELVLVDRKTQVDEFYNGLKVGKARSGQQRHNYAGSSAGRQAANSADLGNRRMGGSRKAIK